MADIYTSYERLPLSGQARIYFGFTQSGECGLTPKQAAHLVKGLLYCLQEYHEDRRADEPEVLRDIAELFVERVYAMEIRTGDTVVFSHPGRLSDVAWARVSDSMKRLFPNNKVIFVEENAKLLVLRPDDGVELLDRPTIDR